ncbi:MAG: HDOD domain-containing protein [Chitinispirillaceae bacterium]
MISQETRKRIEGVLEGIEKLPTVPTVYAQLRKVLASPETTSRDVAAIIEQDQSLTARLLRVVNSAYYGFPRRIRTISRAVVILGFNEIKHLTLTVSVIELFKTEQGSGVDFEKFWDHAIGVAVCTRILMRTAGRKETENLESAFVAGLLHDIGKLVEGSYIKEFFIESLDRATQNAITLFQAENETGGFSHQDIGFYLSQKWELPLDIEATIAFHHNPMLKRNDRHFFPLIASVHIADAIVRGIDFGWGGDPFVPPVQDECWSYLGIGAGQLDVIIEKTYRKAIEMRDLLL